MTTLIGAIQWQPYGSGGTLIAPVQLNSATDSAFTVPISGQWQMTPQYADGVIIDNTINNDTVTVNAGSLGDVTIVPFSRDQITLAPNIGNTIEIDFSSGVVNLLFYKGTPPINPRLNNHTSATKAMLSATLYLESDQDLGEQTLIPAGNWVLNAVSVYALNIITSPLLGFTGFHIFEHGIAETLIQGDIFESNTGNGYIEANGLRQQIPNLQIKNQKGNALVARINYATSQPNGGNSGWFITAAYNLLST